MADGTTHELFRQKNTKYFYGVSLALTGFFIYYNFLFAVSFFLFSMVNWQLTKYVTPDSDFPTLTTGEYALVADAKKRFGWIGGFFATLWNSWWMIYGYICGKHRSWYSHGWGIGTIGRMIHMNIPIAYNAYYMEWYIYITTNSYLYNFVYGYLLSQFLAWFWADAVHLILDTKWAKGKLYKPKKSTW